MRFMMLESVSWAEVWHVRKVCHRLAMMGLTDAVRRCMQRRASAAALAHLQHRHALHARLCLHPAQVRDG